MDTSSQLSKFTMSSIRTESGEYNILTLGSFCLPQCTKKSMNSKKMLTINLSCHDPINHNIQYNTNNFKTKTFQYLNYNKKLVIDCFSLITRVFLQNGRCCLVYCPILVNPLNKRCLKLIARCLIWNHLINN